MQRGGLNGAISEHLRPNPLSTERAPSQLGTWQRKWSEEFRMTDGQSMLSGLLSELRSLCFNTSGCISYCNVKRKVPWPCHPVQPAPQPGCAPSPCVECVGQTRHAMQYRNCVMAVLIRHLYSSAMAARVRQCLISS